MSFFHRLFTRQGPPPEAQPVAQPTPAASHAPIPWGAEDAAELRDYLRSASGRRFGQLLRQRVTTSASHAVRTQPDRLPWECGRSVGIEDTVAQVDLLADWQGALLPASEPPEEPIRRYEEADEDGPDDNLEWLRHQDESDEQYNGYEHRC